MKRLIKKANTKKIGFIGFSSQEFDENKAKKIIEDIFKELDKDTIIISGATNVGIPKLVYEQANKLGMKTIGVMCEKGNDYELAKLDELIVKGKEWGEESDTFLTMIDVLYKIGGGKQSEEEFKKAKQIGISTIEFHI